METPQIEFWNGNFGKEYTERNPQNMQEWDTLYKRNYGKTKIDMNAEFLSGLDKSAKILEVGCNIGLQLLGLQRMGFTNLYGIELQAYAVEKAKENTKGIDIIQGSGFDVPFRDNYFDLVYTSGVLIHIAPNDLPKFTSEMVRCSSKYIWGFEYFSEETKQLNYRGNEGFMWKADFPSVFTKMFSNLTLVSKKVYPYISEKEKGNEDVMYLLEKK
jgi:pseudaminic acid biosynthesis-associated methylase